MSAPARPTSHGHHRPDRGRDFWRYTVALVGSVLAVVLTFTLPVFYDRHYLLSIVAVVLAAYVGGVGPALAATVSSVVIVLGYVALAEPYVVDPREISFAAVFVAIALVVAWVTRDRLESQRKSRRQAAKLEAMFGQASVGLALVDTDGRLERVNARLAEIVGRTPDEALAMPFAQLTQSGDSACDERMLRDIASGSMKESVFDRRYVRRDGRPIWLHVSVAPLHREGDRPDGLIAIVEDVSERRRSEELLRVSEGRYRSLVDASTAIVWTADPQAGFVPPQDSWAATTGQTADEYRGDLWRRAAHPDDRAEFEALFTRAVDDPRTIDTEVRLWHAASTSYRWYSVRAVPRLNGEGRVEEWVGACADIHERRLAEIQLQESEDALRRADHEKDNFLALLAHELRNPLAPIRTAVQLLKLRVQPEADRQPLYSVIDRQVQHLVRMVDDLLDVSRVLRGKVELRLELVPLTDVVAVAVEVCRPMIDAQNQDLRLELPERDLVLAADHVRLAQVVSNLLNNASKYTDRGGRITLAATEADGQAVLKVIDNGAGIPGDLLPRIFEPFVQADRSLARSRGGLGIGLTLVRKIVELHGGHVTASSAGLGRGSEFVVSLPLARQEISSPAAMATDDAASPLPSLRVLVVDDNVDAAETLAMLLRTAGHAVSTVHTGPDALREVDRWLPDIVLLDIGLPGMSGYEVAAALKSHGDSCPALIAITGYGQRAHADQAYDAGFQHHMVKPVDARALEAAIAKCLAARPVRQEINPGH